jgi:hypothetical protein
MYCGRRFRGRSPPLEGLRSSAVPGRPRPGHGWLNVEADDGMKTAGAVVEQSKQTWVLSHETMREKLDSIMDDGIIPQYHDFRGIQDRMTFATDARDGDFRHVRRHLEGPKRRDSAYVVFERPEGVEHVFQFLARRKPEELKKLVAQGLAGTMKDWFVTTKVVEPENIAIIYRFDGQVLYFRETLSQ